MVGSLRLRRRSIRPVRRPTAAARVQPNIQNHPDRGVGHRGSPVPAGDSGRPPVRRTPGSVVAGHVDPTPPTGAAATGRTATTGAGTAPTVHPPGFTQQAPTITTGPPTAGQPTAGPPKPHYTPPHRPCPGTPAHDSRNAAPPPDRTPATSGPWCAPSTTTTPTPPHPTHTP
jgi:hypothetical protein